MYVPSSTFATDTAAGNVLGSFLSSAQEAVRVGLRGSFGSTWGSVLAWWLTWGLYFRSFGVGPHLAETFKVHWELNLCGLENFWTLLFSSRGQGLRQRRPQARLNTYCIPTFRHSSNMSSFLSMAPLLSHTHTEFSPFQSFPTQTNSLILNFEKSNDSLSPQQCTQLKSKTYFYQDSFFKFYTIIATLEETFSGTKSFRFCFTTRRLTLGQTPTMLLKTDSIPTLNYVQLYSAPSNAKSTEHHWALTFYS